jgi:SAM-dependent methyltransferase
VERHNKYVEVIRKYIDSLPLEIFDSSATLIIFKDNPKLAVSVLSFIDERIRKERLLDLGCGYGYLTAPFRDALGFREAHAVDILEERLSSAKKLGLITHRLDLEKDSLPFPPESFDMVIMAGVLNHLKFWDNILAEVRRVLKPGGLIFISNPNLGWWVDRVSLLLGYQPSTVEVSRVYSVGLAPYYPRKKSIQYVHSVTLRGLKELLRFYGFVVLGVWPMRIPRIDLERKVRSRLLRVVVRVVDEVLYRFQSLSIRQIVVAVKSEGLDNNAKENLNTI